MLGTRYYIWQEKKATNEVNDEVLKISAVPTLVSSPMDAFQGWRFRLVSIFLLFRGRFFNVSFGT